MPAMLPPVAAPVPEPRPGAGDPGTLRTTGGEGAEATTSLSVRPFRSAVTFPSFARQGARFLVGLTEAAKS